MKIDQTEAGEAMDMPAHVKTYGNFTNAAKYGIGIIVVILALLAFFFT